MIVNQEMLPVSNKVAPDRLTDFKIKYPFLMPIHLPDALETCHDLENTDYIIEASFFYVAVRKEIPFG